MSGDRRQGRRVITTARDILDLDGLHAALIADPRFADTPRDALEPVEGNGIAHYHVAVRGAAVGGRAVLARVPRLSQLGLGAEDNLRYQEAAFRRAAPSGQTPDLFGVLPVGPRLPMGALLVERIRGSKPVLPRDMSAIARCLARIHCLPVPPPKRRPPLRVHEDPAAETLQVVEEQARFLAEAEIPAGSRAQIEEELAWARAFVADAAGSPHPITLVGTDAHPGNFLVSESRQAVFVDLEKALYGSPAIDLAHASLYTSTMWDPDCAAALSPEDVAAFHQTYFDAAGPSLALSIRPWITPMRRLTWLRTLTWCVRWSVLSRRRDQPWSAHRLPRQLSEHVGRTVAHYLDAETVSAVRAEWAT